MNSHSTPIYIVHYKSNHTTTGQNFTHGTCMPGYADTWISVLYVSIIISSRGEVRERPLQRAHVWAAEWPPLMRCSPFTIHQESQNHSFFRNNTSSVVKTKRKRGTAAIVHRLTLIWPSASYQHDDDNIGQWWGFLRGAFLKVSGLFP